MVKSGIPEFLQCFKQTGKSKGIDELCKEGMEMIQREKGETEFDARQPTKKTLTFITSPHYKMDPRNNSTIFRMEG